MPHALETPASAPPPPPAPKSPHLCLYVIHQHPEGLVVLRVVVVADGAGAQLTTLTQLQQREQQTDSVRS